MSLKVQELAKKCWAMVSALFCRAITQECCAMLKGNRPLPMKCRIRLYIAGVVIGGILLLLSLPLLLYVPFLRGNDVFQSALAVLILTFPSVTINWFIKNRDVSQQQNETLFSNSLQLLFKENGIIANSVGLKELVKLKREGRIDPDRVDLITSSGLQIGGANLREANLQGANLQSAILQGAILQGANLREANLQGANLQGAVLQEAVLQVANLQKADLQGANFYKADLRGADLQGAKLQGANFLEAYLLGVRFEHSKRDKKTKFPKEFDWEQRGIEMIEK